MAVPTMQATVHIVPARAGVCSERRDFERWFGFRGDTWNTPFVLCPRAMRPRRWLGLEAGRQPVMPPRVSYLSLGPQGVRAA